MSLWKFYLSLTVAQTVAISAMPATTCGEEFGGIIRECPPKGDRCRYELSGRTNGLNTIGEFHGSLTLVSLGKVAFGDERFNGIQLSLELPENNVTLYRVLVRRSVDKVSGRTTSKIAHLLVARGNTDFETVDLQAQDHEVLWFLRDPEQCVIELEPKGIDFAGRRLKCVGMAGCDEMPLDDAEKRDGGSARQTREIWLCSDVPFGAVEMTFRIYYRKPADRNGIAAPLPAIRTTARLVEYEEDGSLHKMSESTDAPLPSQNTRQR